MKRFFVIAVVLQLGFLAAEAAKYQLALTNGRKIVLKVVPVDPRSLFLGNYMALSYDVSIVDLAKLPEAARRVGRVNYGDVIYVGMEPSWPYARVVDAARDRAEISDPGLVPVRATVQYSGGKLGQELHLAYDIERYYIPEKRQDDANSLNRWGDKLAPHVAVEAAVDSEGRAMIRRVMVDGRPIGY